MKEFIDKLISRLEEEHEGFINRYGIVGGNVPASIVKRCMNIVNELAEEYKLFGNSEQVKVSEMPTGWIPCKRELPKAGTKRDVWISIENEVISYKAKWYLDHFEWDNGWAIKENILAWMPNDVPAPYTEGE